MAFAVKTKVPGSILVKKMRSGNEFIYYRSYKNSGSWVSSGLPYTKQNIKTVEGILEHLYKELLVKKNQIDYALPTGKTTIQRQFSYFKEDMSKKKLSEITLYEYQFSFDLIIKGDYSPDNYRIIYERDREKRIYRIQEDIEVYLAETEHKSNTINKHLRQLQVFINYLSENNEIPEVNFYKRYKKKVEEKEIIPYTPEEANRIINRAKETDEVLYLLLRLFYLTGGRLNEWLNAYFGIDPFNVDLKNKTITFRNKIRRDQSQTIPISDKVEEVLFRLKELEEERSDYKNKVIPYSPNSKSSITRKISRIEKELGFKQKGRSTHGFRRLLATELFAKEVPIDIIKDIMRHSSIDVTMKAYRKQSQSRIAEQLKKLDR
ncbi:MAG: site-specific integrase [Candidatus Kapaibacterium sp.]|nr:site-specific integrase [Ignavibacteria bacterium]